MGKPELDLHHMEIIELTARLLEEEMELDPRKYAKILSELTDCFRAHFKCEEEHMIENSYHGLETHRTEHYVFILQLSIYNLKFSNEVPTKARELYRFVSGWLLDHEFNMDMEFRDFLNEKFTISAIKAN